MNRIVITQTHYIINENVKRFGLCIDLSSRNFLRYLEPSNKGVFPYNRVEFNAQMEKYAGEKITFEDAIYGITQTLSENFENKEKIEIIFADTCDKETIKLYTSSFKQMFTTVKTFKLSDLFELFTLVYANPANLLNYHIEKGMKEVKYLFIDGFDSIISTYDLSESENCKYTDDSYKQFGIQKEYEFVVPKPKFISSKPIKFGPIRMLREVESELEDNKEYKYPASFTNFGDVVSGLFGTSNFLSYISSGQKIAIDSTKATEYVKKYFDTNDKFVYFGEFAGTTYFNELFKASKPCEALEQLDYMFKYGKNVDHEIVLGQIYYDENGNKLAQIKTKYNKDGAYTSHGIKEFYGVDYSENPKLFADKELKYPIKKFTYEFNKDGKTMIKYYHTQELQTIKRSEFGFKEVCEPKETTIEMVEIKPKYTIEINKNKRELIKECIRIKNKFFKMMSEEIDKKRRDLERDYPEIAKITSDIETLKLKIREIFPDFTFEF